ncbi:NUDE protein [Sphaerosporella brunnea]|uniref:NUDE protein n=2 Tax=Sphaerosporella brunnea TaxID=1250544 RepID=A0A5J5EMQ3_9PEZI|nr:NUDE protein [Sphaerosporella brunnea]
MTPRSSEWLYFDSISSSDDITIRSCRSKSSLETSMSRSRSCIALFCSRSVVISFCKAFWASKYNKSKTEANTAQNALQKEITTLREQNRAMQLRLRDMEVSNDDFERQERIVMSSLEDIESKYNHSLERGVMLEEEVRATEQEREALRIEVQRLRDEMSDMKVEQEITVEKLNNALAIAAKYGTGSLHHVPPPKYPSPLSDTSTVLSDEPGTPMTTPSIASTATPHSEHSGPPSPPMSEASTTPSQPSRMTTPFNDPATTPRPRNNQKPTRRHGRTSSIGGSTGLPIPTIPSSRSLHQIRGLIGQMQRLEQRVQSARSKLPGPAPTPPRASHLTSQMPVPINIASVPLRSTRKSRAPSVSSSITSSSSFSNGRDTPAGLGFNNYNPIDRPASRLARPESRAALLSRPDSRASGSTSRSSLSGGPERPSAIPQRPQSRTSMSSRMALMGGNGGHFGEYEISAGRKSIGGGDGPFGFGGNRRNTLNNGGSAIPLPKKTYGGRLSSVGLHGFEEGGNSTQSSSTNGIGRRLTGSSKRVGEK